jgi:NAD(P)-dependent dehydrogenase (short-subunit alcohol dehydrogenase family)
MDVRNLGGKTVLVTGAASGIGKETALACARRRADLVICDVNEGGLKETEQQAHALGCEVYAQRVDVADRTAMKRFSEAVHQRVPALDLLVNNAGVGLAGGFLYTTLEDWDWIVGINLLGVVYGCHFFVPAMVERGQGGHVVNVSSAAGFSATELLAAYATTKFAVLGLSEALRDELSRHKIGVTAICPGIINTPIAETSPMRGPDASPELRQRLAETFRRRNYGPRRVAENILKAVQRNRSVAPISPEAWTFYLLKRFLPGVMAAFNRKMGERMRRESGLQ